MSCEDCKTEKTLYDKTVARRVQTATRRTKRTVAGAMVVGILATGSAATLSPAHAADFSGFTTHAQATPLRIEIYEPAIPIPASPQAEFNFSYTKVDGSSGPIGTARASALWPGDGVGEGLKTFGEQLGLPGALTDNGYPVQINAQSPGDTASATQEFFPGNTGKVSTTDKKSVAKGGYGTTGDVAEGDAGDKPAGASTNPLSGLQSGGLGALTGLLTGTQTAGPGEATPSASPLGALSALVNASGMESISSTTYDADAESVTATATARLGTIGLVGGLVKLDGVEVVTKTTSNIAGGAKTSQVVNIGGLSIVGTKFYYTGTGFVAAGKNTAIPALPDAPVQALAALGISFSMGKVVTTKDGAAGSVSAEGLRITIDTQPLLSKLPKLPLADLVSKLPDLPGQAAILKGLIVALGDAHPRVDLVLGQSTASAQTVAGIGEDGGTGGVLPPTGTTPTTGTDLGTGDTPSAGEVPPTATGPTDGVTQNINPNPAAFVSGLPKLGGLPTWLALAGIAVAVLIGWYVRQAGLLVFGNAITCTHGLKSGIPDLRKV
ncbi:MAG: hypothetical protein ACJ72D_22545 [Marmoricola sp.]